MDKILSFNELQAALDALITEAELFRGNLTESGIEPDYWASYLLDLQDKMDAVIKARENLERADNPINE